LKEATAKAPGPVRGPMEFADGGGGDAGGGWWRGRGCLGLHRRSGPTNIRRIRPLSANPEGCT
jgi:hypothetical protein